MFNFNIELAVECVKSVIDNTQCSSCDKLNGPCVRFPCGHSVCEICAQRTEECLFCISSPAKFLIDNPQTIRVTNASTLLRAFQETFKIDVYKRQRISEHLKLEKQIFPKCIQAPHKYANKRKSFNISSYNKENLNPKIFPGEETKSSDIIIMKKSVQYVQNWLNQHENMPQNLPRRPFGDINVNTQSLIQKTMKDIQKLKNEASERKTKHSTFRKRPNLRSIYKTSLRNVNNNVKNSLEIRSPLSQLESKKDDNKYGDSKISHKYDKNESGIVLDDEPLVLDNTDINIISKDNQAWLAVIEAAAKDEYEEKIKNNFQNEKEINNSLQATDKFADSSLLQCKNNSEELDSSFNKNVLFYKRSTLFDTCNLCNNYLKNKMKPNPKVDKFNDVSIVINNSAFMTTIKITQCEEKKKVMINQNSVAIQTEEDIQLLKHDNIDFCGNITQQKRKNMINTHDTPTKMQKASSISQSLDVFATEKNTKQNSVKQQKCLVIEDSDTDSDISCDNTHEVIVDVHRPSVPESVECGILRTLSKGEYEHKMKRQKRGHTPNSSNSSDKENLDPNRKKRVKLGKKHKNKK